MLPKIQEDKVEEFHTQKWKMYGEIAEQLIKEHKRIQKGDSISLLEYKREKACRFFT
jgi:hypothetical protein